MASYVVMLRAEKARYDQAVEVYRTAQRMWDEKRYGEARTSYEAYRALGRQGHTSAWLDRDVTMMIARCMWRAGDPKAALGLFDEALAAASSMELCCERALCQAEVDAEAALAWLQKRDLGHPHDKLVIALFHRARQEWRPAIKLLKPILADMESDREDGIDTLCMSETVSEAQLSRLSLAQELLEPLAECLVGLGDMDAAMVVAQRGIAVGRRVLIAKVAEHYEVEGGSVACRVVLAQIAAHAHNWAEASRNLGLAHLMGGRYGRLRDVIERLDREVQRGSGNR